MKRVGVFYATREGQAKKVAERVAGALIARALEVAVHEVRDDDSALVLTESDAAVLVASVHMGKHEPEMVTFVKRHKEELEAKPAAFLSVCMAEAAACDANAPAQVRETAAETVRTQLATFLDATKWHPAEVHSVAGALLYTHYNVLVRWVMKQIAKREARPIDTSRDYEYTDWASLDAFAERFADELQHATAHAA